MASSAKGSSSGSLFVDKFEVSDINPEGKKFQKVSRIVAHSENYDVDLTLDVNTHIYKMSVRDKFDFQLAKVLSLDGTDDTKAYNQNKGRTLADQFEYVCHGKVFKIVSQKQQGLLEVYASFGGLLMCLKGGEAHLKVIEPDSKLYALIKKSAT